MGDKEEDTVIAKPTIATGDDEEGGRKKHDNHVDVFVEDEDLEVTGSVKVYASLATINMMKCGYDIGVSAMAGPWIQTTYGLDDLQLEYFMGTVTLFAIWGILWQPFLADRYGRRFALAAAAVVNLLGQTIMITSYPSYQQLMIGRAVVGIGYGMGLFVRSIFLFTVLV